MTRRLLTPLDPPLACSFDYLSALSWFFDQFYVISGELDSGSVQLYGTNMKVQAKALTGMINMLLSMYKDKSDEDRQKGFGSLAKGHGTNRGVRSYQYAAVGGIFMKTLQRCLGRCETIPFFSSLPSSQAAPTPTTSHFIFMHTHSGYDEATDMAWKRIFSATLKILLPAAIKVLIAGLRRE